MTQTLNINPKSESEIRQGTLSVRELLKYDGVAMVLVVYLATFTLAFAYTACELASFHTSLIGRNPDSRFA